MGQMDAASVHPSQPLVFACCRRNHSVILCKKIRHIAELDLTAPCEDQIPHAGAIQLQRRDKRRNHRGDWAKGRDGEYRAASGLRLLPRDLLKIGQLVLAGGVWNSDQIVPPDWGKRALTPVVTIADGRRYGYRWYLGTSPPARLSAGNAGWAASAGVASACTSSPSSLDELRSALQLLIGVRERRLRGGELRLALFDGGLERLLLDRENDLAFS
jgi:hypothetical protein